MRWRKVRVYCIQLFRIETTLMLSRVRSLMMFFCSSIITHWRLSRRRGIGGLISEMVKKKMMMTWMMDPEFVLMPWRERKCGEDETVEKSKKRL